MEEGIFFDSLIYKSDQPTLSNRFKFDHYCMEN